MKHTDLLAIENISKQYFEKILFTNLSMKFSAGNFALVGANGIGKSTLLRVLAGAESVDAGNIFIGGIDLMRDALKAKRILAYVPDKTIAYPFLSGEEFLSMIASLRGLSGAQNIQEMIEKFEISVHLKTRFEDMSLGTQRKFFIAAALLDNPRLLVLDEPTNGLDRHARQVLQNELNEHSKTRLTVFSSHDDEFIRAVDARRLEMHEKNVTLKNK